MAAKGGLKTVIISLLGNVSIAAFKMVAAVISGSSSMLAEAYHSFADSGNQVLLLIGLKRSEKGPTETHPFGMGKAQFFWSFLVMVVLFTFAGGLSVKEGIHKVREPHAADGLLWIFLALGFAIAVEMYSLILSWRELRAAMERDGIRSVVEAVRESTDPVNLTVFFENGLAVIGGLIAGIAIALAKVTGAWVLDGVASILIGIILMVGALFLAIEVKGLLIGEAISQRKQARIKEVVTADEAVRSVVSLKTMVIGPEEVLVALEVEFEDKATVPEVEAAIDRVEHRVSEVLPGAKTYIEARSVSAKIARDSGRAPAKVEPAAAAPAKTV
jgi:cation diffusion facilitator family transporter